MTTATFDRFLADSQRTPSLWLLYQFPSGRSASVITDPSRPLRFEMEVDGLGAEDSTVTADLTTEQVEAKLTELAAA